MSICSICVCGVQILTGGVPQARPHWSGANPPHPPPRCATGAEFTLALVSKPSWQVVLACKLTCRFLRELAWTRLQLGKYQNTTRMYFSLIYHQFLSSLHFLQSVELLLLLRKTSEFGADVHSHHCVSVGCSGWLPPQSQTCFPWHDNRFDCYQSNHCNNAALVGNLTFGSILISCLTLFDRKL